MSAERLVYDCEIMIPPSPGCNLTSISSAISFTLVYFPNTNGPVLFDDNLHRKLIVSSIWTYQDPPRKFFRDSFV
jgi:hypothetical protein